MSEPADPPRREVGAHIAFRVEDPTEFVLAIETADGVPLVAETFEVRHGGSPLATREERDEAGTRLRVFAAATGTVEITYSAVAEGRARPLPATAIELVRALRPSRYVPSDALTDLARGEFPGLDGAALVRAVGAWVHERLEYRAEASAPTGGALETLDAGAGVCRDFAHVTAGLLRALDVPARLVSVYAPELEPMDFHAVVEAWIEQRWVVVDSTRLAPRSGLLRVATGRDAADTAWATNTLADVELLSLEVEARAAAPLTPDDPEELVELG
ncbi:MAG: transglutaminase family protein [Actinomycetales bacterium]|nr:transglutaminase family protein [Actinomycetales bacterium]